MPKQSDLLWVRLVFGGSKKLWHAYIPFTDVSLCKRQNRNYQRTEASNVRPTQTVCKFCLEAEACLKS